MTEYDAVVVGAGPNGLTAAARLAKAGHRVLVVERGETIGGGSRTSELIEPGSLHDVCAAVHPFAVWSPAFQQLGLDVTWLQPQLPMVHPFVDRPAAVLHRDLATTADGFGVDRRAYRALVGPLLKRWDTIGAASLGPPLWGVIDHPLAMARFGAMAAVPASLSARAFRTLEARSMFAGLAAHSMLPMSAPFTTGVGLALALAAHANGWPIAKGGSQSIVNALAAIVTSHGGEIVTGHEVRSLKELPSRRSTLLDVTPPQANAIIGRTVYRRRWRFGPGACKVDYVLSGPMPWSDQACHRTATVHLGPSYADIARSEAESSAGRMPPQPFVLLSQPSALDPDRSAGDHHLLWAYSHVPNGSTIDASDRIEAQLDRFAPGWRDLIVGKAVRTASSFEDYNPNDVGGDIAGGSMALRQFLFRPRIGYDPYRIAQRDVWLCSSSTPPGAGVHGMCGWHAAGRVLAGYAAGTSTMGG